MLCAAARAPEAVLHRPRHGVGGLHVRQHRLGVAAVKRPARAAVARVALACASVATRAVAAALDAFIDAGAAMSGLAVDPAYRHGVKIHLNAVTNAAKLVLAHRLADDAEPGPVQARAVVVGRAPAAVQPEQR